MLKREKDTLFNIEHVGEDFIFNDEVARVFDDMIDRSVPFYAEVIESAAQLLDRFLNEGELVCDLGCSTGSTLLQFSRILGHKQLRFLGCDNSPAMLEEARQKAEMFGKGKQIEFRCSNIVDFSEKNVDAVVLNYTLQFLRPLQRMEFLQRIFKALRPGGILILSEKTILDDQRLNRDFIHIYHQFKKARGYSELEIARKREALENVLIPFSREENLEMLHSCGFCSVTTFFQWFNFCSILAVKPK
jgi:tRNA (cmo5U34)-methyltransferase